MHRDQQFILHRPLNSYDMANSLTCNATATQCPVKSILRHLIKWLDLYNCWAQWLPLQSIVTVEPRHCLRHTSINTAVREQASTYSTWSSHPAVYICESYHYFPLINSAQLVCLLIWADSMKASSAQRLLRTHSDINGFPVWLLGEFWVGYPKVWKSCNNNFLLSRPPWDGETLSG